MLKSLIVATTLKASLATAADSRCLESFGEARIINEDIPSARLEAIARARWNAIEQAIGVQISAQTLVQDMQLVDDVISKKVSGFISSHKILNEELSEGGLRVRMTACVEPEKASEALSNLGRNKSISVVVPARKPRVTDEGETTTSKNDRARKSITRTTDEQEESNIFSENLIGRLAETGYTVTDIAPTHLVDAEAVDKAIRSGNFLSMRSVLYKTLSNLLLLGKIDYTVSQRRGDDIGYGLENPFNRVTVRLTYRLINHSQETGQFVILGAGTAENQGVATSVEDAASKALQLLADKNIPVIINKLSNHIKGITKKIRVTVTGSPDIGRTLDMKQLLSEIAWVTDIEAIGPNEFKLSYPENTLYLANSLSRDTRLKVTEFAPDRVTLKYIVESH